MPHSFCKIYTHSIFSTKDRQRWLDESVRSRVHGYLATIARKLGCSYVVVGGVEDHVHILTEISKNVNLANMVGRMKEGSSKFIKTLGAEYEKFYWQSGYSVFSLGPTRVDDVKSYIERQVEHHRRQTFKEEYLAFLKRYGIEYDKRYVWE